MVETVCRKAAGMAGRRSWESRLTMEMERVRGERSSLGSGGRELLVGETVTGKWSGESGGPGSCTWNIS